MAKTKAATSRLHSTMLSGRVDEVAKSWRRWLLTVRQRSQANRRAGDVGPVGFTRMPPQVARGGHLIIGGALASSQVGARLRLRCPPAVFPPSPVSSLSSTDIDCPRL